MKKGLVLLVLSFAIICGGVVSAVMCTDGVDSPTGCVCGHSPNSTIGYGQVIIGAAVYSCDNIGDGLCPEDFSDPMGFTANCGSCADPDCTGTISGVITDENGRPIDRVEIIGGPIPYNQSANLESTTTTDVNGIFNDTFITGWNYTIRVTKDSYTTLVYTVTVIRNQELILPTLSVPNGTCYEDCTNVFGRCSAECDGVEFNGSDTKCQFYNETRYTAAYIQTIKALCNNKLKGTEVFLGWNDTNVGVFVECCGDNPLVNPREQPYLKYYGKVENATCEAKDVIKIEKIARYNDVPVRIIITYWD